MKLPVLRHWRTILPASMLAAVVALVARHQYPLPADTGLLLWFSRLDPLLLASYLRWEWSFPAWGWLPLAIVLLTLAAGRVFCGWLCPLGGLLALVHSGQIFVRRRLGRATDGPPAWTGRLRPYRYHWLLALAALLLGSGWTLYLSPFHLLTSELSRLWRGEVPWLATALIAAGLLVFPRFWCVYLCPTGLTLSLLARWRRWAVEAPADCRRCGLCARVCPTGAAAAGPERAGADCLVCGRCVEVCPAGDFALAGREDSPVAATAGGAYTRREVIRAGVALAVAAAAVPALGRKAGAQPLRPPGALEEDEFLARCSRCGRCIKACPSKCLKAMPLSSGAALFLTPVLVPREARCELTRDCQKVCPTGAIAHLPVEKAIIGFAEIDRTRCLGWAEGKLCLLCQEQCPQHAIVSDKQNRPSVVSEKCVGCGACENGCPLEEPAIVVRPQPKRRRP
jgi:polyferredoxin